MKKTVPKILNICFKIIIIIVLLKQLFLKEWFFCFICLYSLIILSLPKFLNKIFKIKISGILEIILYLFVFAAKILGEIYGFFITISWWDNMLHIIGGFILTGIGVFILNYLNKNKMMHYILSPFYVILSSICFSVAILVSWEFVEYGADLFFNSDMQKDTIVTSINSIKLNHDNKNKTVKLEIKELKVNDENWVYKYGGYIDIGLHDTMTDLLTGLLGTIIFAIFEYKYLHSKNAKCFAQKFIPAFEKK